jgi:hypothetical protein
MTENAAKSMTTGLPFPIPTIHLMNLISQLGMYATAGVALAISSCSTGGRSPSGFLSNYQQMDGGYGTADAVSAYVKPGVDLIKYDSVMVDPVTTIVATPGISAAVKDQIAAYLGDSLRGQLVENFTLVSVPGPTTLRVRTALTDVIENQNVGKPVITVHTGARATLSGPIGSTEVATFVSNVSFEGEIVESLSGERLLGNTDHRLGAKREATASTSWAGVRSGVNQSVVRLNDRLMKLRAR